MSAEEFGRFFRKCRTRLGLTLRSFCRANGFDAANISRLERGQIPPPASRKKLEEYARALRLKDDSDEWLDFFDLAAAASGKIPADIMSDRQLVLKLPLVFRTLRGEKVSREQLDGLIERLRKA